MNAEFGVVLTTTGSAAKAREIACAALNAKLAACAQLFPIESLYVWKSETHEDKEIALHLKSRSADFEPLTALIRRLHDYETPEILFIDIAKGDAAYLDWLSQSVQR